MDAAHLFSEAMRGVHTVSSKSRHVGFELRHHSSMDNESDRDIPHSKYQRRQIGMSAAQESVRQSSFLVATSSEHTVRQAFQAPHSWQHQLK